eukprot:jgi/Ulvmu1/9790/UM056_0030.1
MIARCPATAVRLNRCTMSLAACLALLSLIRHTAASQLFHTAPLIIGHRGSPCSFPEETMQSYEDAALNGASYLEMDVVATKDRRLVLRHDLTLDDSTNVKYFAKKHHYKQKRRTAVVDGRNMTGFFVSDFTFDQIHNLSAIQPFPFRDAQYNRGKHTLRVLEFKQILQGFKNWQRQALDIGLYIEIKHPDYHAELEEPMNLPEMMMDAIVEAGITSGEASKLVIQCFSFDGLKQFSKLMKSRGYDIPMVLLRECQDGLPDEDMLKELSALSSNVGVGPDKFMLLDTEGTKECNNEGEDACPTGPEPDMSKWNCRGRLKQGYKQLMPSQNTKAHLWIRMAHKLGVVVHAWTVRNEDRFMALDFRSDVHLELDALMSKKSGLGIDGVFVDCPISAAAWSTAQQFAPARREVWTDQGALSKFRRQTDGTEPPPAIPPPQPIAAAITLSLVAALIFACCVWVWLRGRKERRDAHGTYKAMMSPRDGESTAPVKQSELSWSAHLDVESGRDTHSDGGGAMWSPGGQRVGNRSIAETRPASSNGLRSSN